MQTEEFQDALETLMQMSREKRVAIMCAEAVPWRCHRSLVADALIARGVPVIEILSQSNYRTHKLTPFAQVKGTQITYPSRAGCLVVNALQQNENFLRDCRFCGFSIVVVCKRRDLDSLRTNLAH